jgi:ATP-binding cassette subfamily B protein
MRVIKAYVQQKKEVASFKQVNDGWTKANRSAVQVISIMMPVIMLVINGGIIGTLWLGSYKVADNSIEVGAILAFINYLMIILMALMSISMVSIFITRAFPSAGRVHEVLETPITIQDNEDSYRAEKIHGDIEFRDVSFSYSKNEERVLQNIDFTITAGQKIGIIGSTGSGKSTLVKLIARLYDVDEGAILLDGVNITNYHLQTLRSAIGFVTQKAMLFSGPISENIRYGDEQADQEDLENAAEEACADEFISRLEAGYDHTLTQGATNLSGGQKQRLSLARAFVRSAPILILDDVTSAVDAKSEAIIQESLRAKSNQTVLLIASKISSILDADKIIVLEDGQLVGQGTHEQLLHDCEVYQEIYVSQGGNMEYIETGREV